ncbi:hypothetical protein Fmac_024889 [Flemingia macrophylla]|uniref:Uncharacterized protein n=1 Tax=Flemingia macrophylla TaxID=520843 RepID=A0ABD1LQN9_9FABA
MPLSIEEFTTWLAYIAETRKVEAKLDLLVNLVTQLIATTAAERRHLIEKMGSNPAVSAQEMMPLSLEEFTTWLQIHLRKLESARNDAIVIKGVHNVATDTSAKTRKVEGNLDPLVNLVTQLAVNQKPAYVARRRWLPTPSSFSAGNDSIVIRGVHDVATDTSAEIRKVEGKLDALVNLVTQLAVNQKPASVARVCGIPSSNDHHTNVCHHSSSAQTLDREDGFQLLRVSVQQMMPLSLEEIMTWLQIHLLKLESARNDVIVIRGVHDVATYTSAETRKVEHKLDPLVILVTHLAVNEKPASVARVCGNRSSNDHHTNRRWLPTPSSFSPRNDVILIRGVHDVTTDISAETRKVEGKQDALVNLVTQLAVNQKPASIQRVRVHDVATDTSAETRKVEGKLDALVNLVTQLAVNQKPASVARVSGIRHHSSRGQTLDREDGFQLLAVSVQEMMPLSLEEFTMWQQIHLLKLESFGARNDAILIRGLHDVATDTSAETKMVEDTLVNLATTAVEARHLIERWLPTPRSFSARNDTIVVRGVHDVATDVSTETRKVEGKLDAFVNLVTQLAVNQKPASIARVCGIRSSNDHHANVCPSS